MINFPSIAFQSSLGLSAVLFGVFGFLYSVFAMYLSVVQASGSVRRPPIVRSLQMVCRILAVITVLNTALTCYSLYLLYLCGTFSDLNNLILAGGFALITLAIAIFCVVWAFWFMGY